MDTERADNAEEPEDPQGGAGGGTGDGAARAESGAAARDEPPGRVRDDSGEADDGRPARRFSPVIVASVAAAVLAVGAGGVYLATAGSQGHRDVDYADPGATGAPPPLALDDATGGAAGPASGSANGIAPGEPNPYGVTYRATGDLPDGPDAAPVHLARTGATRAQVVRLAAALGAEGTPVDEGGSWRVGNVADGTGATLTVDKQAPGTWTFNRYAQGGDNCKGTTCEPGSPTSSGSAASEAEAKKAAASVLKAEGQDDAKVDASRVVDNRRVVNADPVVGGLPTYGWTTDLSVASGGQVVGGSGRLTPLVKSDTYPVLDADKTLDLLNGTAADTGRRMGPGGCATPVPPGGRLESPCGQGSSGTGTARPNDTPSVSASAPAGETVPVTGAEFGLATRSVAGQPALVPAWLFQVADPDGTNSSLGSDGSTVAYPAVDPRYLAPAARSGTASGKPSAQGDGDETTTTVPADGYTTSASGDRLTLSFTGGVCSTYTAAAKESGGTVTVTVTSHGHRGRVCVMLARFYERTVRLTAPLDGRSVVNADGTPVPRGTQHPAPTQSTGGGGQETMQPMQPR